MWNVWGLARWVTKENKRKNKEKSGLLKLSVTITAQIKGKRLTEPPRAAPGAEEGPFVSGLSPSP